jgi:aspartyl-tRNA(Asn)/glutamyl-tRNA(Gln) amidotransferase subunit B
VNYVPTIGLEIHSQLATSTKIFCGCSTEFGGEPNTHACPVCLGMPGVLPVLNRRAVELAVRMALLTGGEVQHRSRFARKNYFYPDLPKGYQISMFEFPLIKGGGLTVKSGDGEKYIRLNRIHLEEDAGKLIHMENRDESHFDVNRCGVPLVEIVTEPDFETVEEVTGFLNTLREMLVFSGASLGNMFKGNIRVDANISIRPEGATELGTRTEIKNMNSFVNAVTAIKKETARQRDVVSSGGRIVQETLLYDAGTDTLASMRSKEEAHDYRYFPEPDLVPVVITDEWIEAIRNELPELRDTMRDRFEKDYGIPPYDAEIVTTTPALARYYENVIAAGADPKMASNWVMGEVLRVLNDCQIEIDDFTIPAARLATLIKMVSDGTISGSIAKNVFEDMLERDVDPDVIVEEKGLLQISDTSALMDIAKKIVETHPDEADAYRGGKAKLMGFFVGQLMKETQGKANPREANAIFKDLLT